MTQCYKHELDLFNPPEIQTLVEEGFWSEVKPFSNFNTGTIEFLINPSESDYLDLSQIEFHCKVKLIKNDASQTLLKETDDIAPVNNFLHSLFSQIEVTIDGKSTENSNSTYGYKAYLLNLLNHSKEAKDTYLHSHCFVKDEEIRGRLKESTDEQVYLDDANTIKAMSTDATPAAIKETIKANDSAKVRFNFVQKAWMIGRLYADIFSSNKYMLNNVKIGLKLIRAKPEFYLIGKTYSNELAYVEDCFLLVRRVKCSSTVLLNHSLALEKQNAKYPLKRVVVREKNLIPSSSVATVSNIHTGVLPTRVVIGLVRTKSYGGDITLNPFNFEHFDVNEIALKVNGKNNPYANSIKIQYNNSNYTEAYNTLFQNIRLASNDITYTDFSNGYAIYAFDLSPDLCSNYHLSLNKEGDIEFEIKFKEVSKKNISAIIYMEFDNILEIDKNRNVLFDYKA